MQVTLDIVDWNELLKFGSPRAFLDYLHNEENDPRWLLDADALGWESDSFLQYNEVAWAIEGILDRLTPSERRQVEVGLLPLISQGKQVDEFGMSPASEGHYFISASPATTHTIHQNLSLLELPRLAALVKEVRPPDAGELLDHMDTDFTPFIEQFQRVVAAAVKRSYGLLGHCG